MFEFEIFHPEIQKSRIIMGYNFADACRRSNVVAPNEWIVIYQYYID